MATDYINGKAHIRIDLNPDGFEVYSNGTLAYTSKEPEEGTLKGSISDGFAGYNNVLSWLNLSPDTDYTQIRTFVENDDSKAYFKVEGTTLYVMTAVKQDKIHCDNVTAGDITYGWWNGMASEIYMKYNDVTYNVGSHVYDGMWANAISWNNDPTLVDSEKSVRSYMALGTFDNDNDTDKGCILLNTYDLTDIGLTEQTIIGAQVAFSGYVGPNDGAGQWETVDDTQTYNLK